jgi:hypothetical protein
MTAAALWSGFPRQSPPDTAQVFTSKENDHRDAKNRRLSAC